MKLWSILLSIFFTACTVYADVSVPAASKTIWTHYNFQRLNLYLLDQIYLGDDDSNSMVIQAPSNLSDDTTVFTFPNGNGTSNYGLLTDGAGNSSWAEVILPSASQTLTNKTIDADLNSISNIDNNEIKAAAGIERSKIAAGTINQLVVNDGSGFLSSIAQLDISRGGTNSGTALNNNRMIISSSGSIVEQSAQTANRALATDINGLPISSSVTDTELGYLSGVTSAIQTQINGKLANIVEDTTPQLGGNLDLNGSSIVESAAAVLDYVPAQGRVDLGSTGSIAVPSGTTAQRPGTPVAGDLRFNSDDTGFEGYDGTSWGPISGSGSGSDLGRLSNPTLEFNANDWNAFDDGSVTEPIDGTGGSPTITCTQTTTSTEILKETGSLELAHGSSDEQGQGCSADFTLYPGDAGQLKQVKLNYGNTPNYADGDIEAFIICDIDNSSTNGLRLVPFQRTTGNGSSFSSNTSRSGFFTDEFIAPQDIDDGAGDCRFITMIVTTSTSSYDFHTDDIIVAPESTQVSSVSYGKWEDFTMTINADTTAPTKASGANESAKFQRIPEGIHIQYTYQQSSSTGAANGSGAYFFELPSQFTIDSSRYLSSTDTNNVGSCHVRHGSNLYAGYAQIDLSSGGIKCAVGNDITASATNPVQKIGSGYLAIASTGIIVYSFDVFVAVTELAGKGISHQLTQDIIKSNVRVRASSNNGASYNTTDTIVYEDEEVDTTNSYDETTGIFTCPSDGQYNVSGLFTISGTPTNPIVIDIELNGTSIHQTRSVSTASPSATAVTLVDCTKDDTINIAVQETEAGSVTLDSNSFRNSLSITKVSDQTAGKAINFGVATDNESGLVFQNKWQKITLAQDVTATSSDLSGTAGNSAFIFNNLVVGKIYKITLQATLDLTGTTALESSNVQIIHNSVVVGRLQHRNDGQTDESQQTASTIAIFEASATSVVFAFNEGSGSTATLLGNSDYNETFAMIEELNNYGTESTDF